jgi:hypothetical protein
MVPELVRRFPELRRFVENNGGHPLSCLIGSRDNYHKGDIAYSFLLPSGASFRPEFLQGEYAMIHVPADPVSRASAIKEYRSISLIHAKEVLTEITQRCPKPDYNQLDRFDPTPHYDFDDLPAIPESVGPDKHGYYNRELFNQHMRDIISSREELLARAGADLKAACPAHVNVLY